ncbi:unnamed protein product [Peniophora sp. CBMAI 1063]|nr:unnamed protein product [Peniophora sp. CBMAI 1063]
MFFTAALRDVTNGSSKQWKVVAWHKRVPTAVFRLLSFQYGSRLAAGDPVPPRAYFVRTRQQALRNVTTHKDARGTKWQIDTTPIGTCVLPPLPGEESDGMPGFQMHDATEVPRDRQLLQNMKDGEQPIRLVRAGVPLPIGYVLVEQTYEGRWRSDYHFRPTVPVTIERYNSALRSWMYNYSEDISYDQLRQEFRSPKR